MNVPCIDVRPAQHGDDDRTISLNDFIDMLGETEALTAAQEMLTTREDYAWDPGDDADGFVFFGVYDPEVLAGALAHALALA